MFDDSDYQRLIEEAESATHTGTMADPDASAKMTNASCGDEVEVFLKLSSNGQKITNIVWQGQGCIISRAATNVLATFLIGGNIQEVSKMSLEQMLTLLAMKEISPGRLKCLTLGLEATKKALKGMS